MQISLPSRHTTCFWRIRRMLSIACALISIVGYSSCTLWKVRSLFCSFTFLVSKHSLQFDQPAATVGSFSSLFSSTFGQSSLSHVFPPTPTLFPFLPPHTQAHYRFQLHLRLNHSAIPRVSFTTETFLWDRFLITTKKTLWMRCLNECLNKLRSTDLPDVFSSQICHVNWNSLTRKRFPVQCIKFVLNKCQSMSNSQ